MAKEDFGAGDELIGDAPAAATGKPAHVRNWRDWFMDFAAGVLQGEIDPEEGIGQIVRATTGAHLPSGWQKRLDDLSQRAGQSSWGTAGRVVGNIFNPVNVIPAARAAGFGERAIAGGVTGALAPTEGADKMSAGELAKQRAQQGLFGGAAGSTLPGLARYAGRLAPWLGHTAVHHTGLGHAALQSAAKWAKTPSAMARGFSQTSPRRIGRTAGTLYGEGAEPDEDEEESPITTPVPSAPASAPTPVFRSGKGDYFR